MLTFESPFYEIEDVIIFRDHRSLTTFHYLAGPPRLTKTPEGKDNLTLLKYRNALDAGSASPRLREQLGGGFLMFGVDCGIDASTKETIREKLQAMQPPDAGPISLVPVLYTAGKVHVLALDKQSAVETEEDNQGTGSEFVRGILGTATPSLLQDQRAIFSLALTPDAATLLENAYESELSPIGVMYELEFSGLRPALEVKAHVDKKRVYNKLEAELKVGFDGAGGGGGESEGGGGTSVSVNAKIGATLEWLRESGAIDLEIVRQQEGATIDQMEQRAMALLKESLLNEFFRPTMTANRPQPSSAATAAAAAAAATRALQAGSQETSTGSSGSGGKVEIGFQLKYVRQDELKTATYDYSSVAPEKRTHAPNGFFSALTGSTDKDDHIRQIDLDSLFFKTLEVGLSTTGDFDSIDLKKAIVEMQYGGTVDQPRVEEAFEFDPADLDDKAFTAFLDGDDVSYRHRTRYSFGQSDAVAAQEHSYTTGWETTTSRALVVHPPDDVSMLKVRVEPGPVDWDIVEKIETKLSYDDEVNDFHTDRTFLMEETSVAEDWVVRLSDPARRGYTVNHIWYLKDHSEIEGEPYVEDSPHLFVKDPFDHRMDVRVVPQVDPNNVKRIHVELHYEDEDNEHTVRKSLSLEGPDFSPKVVTIPVMDPEHREYTYSVTLVKADGRSENHEPKVHDLESITITEGGVYLDVNLVLLGDLLSHGVDAVQVDLKAEPLEGERETVQEHLFLPGDANREKKRLLLRADRPQAFSYRTIVFGAEGPQQSEWIEHRSAILALQVRALAGSTS